MVVTTMHNRNTGTSLRRGRIVAAVAIAGAVAVVAAGCTSNGDKQVADPSRVLQTVDTRLSPNGSITGISDTAISVATSDRSSSKTTEHDPAKAAADLPIRVTTQYTSAKGSGTDLSDLDGYSGRVEIDLTVENLTVKSKQLRYDVAGTSRTKAALVGAPFSVAASTVLKGVAPSRIVTGSDDSTATTDGVVSTDTDGDAVVQWGTLLAPPTSGASSTLHLVADVEDFTAPTFDLAAQPGLSTDLSSKGIMAAAFGSDTDSELALQRRTIDLIAQVNEVLARAGGTITEVRSNLETTSKTLGVSTAQRLQESSSSLASTMQGLGTELSSLKGDLGSTVGATQSTVLGQLDQTVNSLDSLLGDTSANAPEATVDGEGCAAVPADPGATSSVYGNLLRVSSQLDGYAKASEACKLQVSSALTASVGPEKTDDTVCAPGADAADSLTCGLYTSSRTIVSSLASLVQTGEDIAAQLKSQSLQPVLDDSRAVNGQLADINARIAELDGPNGAGFAKYKEAFSNLDDNVKTINTHLGRFGNYLTVLNKQAVEARAALGDADDQSRSLQAQNAATAAQVCVLLQSGQIDQVEADALRGNLTAKPCVVDPANPDATLSPSPGFDKPMDQRLTDQATAWDAIITATNPNATDPNTIAGSVLDLRNDLVLVQNSVQKVDDAVGAGVGGEESVQAQISSLHVLTEQAAEDNNELNGKLLVAVSTFDKQVRDAFTGASTGSSDEIQAIIGKQSARVAKTAKSSNDALVKAFDQSISGLNKTSDEVTKDSKGTIDQQKGKLEQQTSGLASAVDAQTKASLQRIDESTSASTRDVEGAATLLAGDLSRVMLDLGDRKVNGSGILGAMATSAAKSDTADYQLALASQNAAGYANVRAEDVAGILLKQAQLRASLDAAIALPAFRMKVPAGATSTTLYTFRIGATK